MSQMRVAIIGAGVVGLAVAYHLSKGGARVTIIDRDPEGDKTSFGNAGGIAVTEVVPASGPGALRRALGWMLDPLGPVAVRPTHAPRLVPWLLRFVKVGTAAEAQRISSALAAINRRVYQDLVPMLADAGLSGELIRNGALSVYETEEGHSRDAAEWACKRAQGMQIQEMTGDEAREMEPALGALVKRAVFTPQSSHVRDPKRLLQGLRAWLHSSGVEIAKGEVLQIVPQSPSAISLTVSGGGRVLVADSVVVAAGAWSGALARRLGDRALLESERGYNTTFPQPGLNLSRQLLFPERKFVATPLSCGLRIGGAVELGGLSARPNFKRCQAFVAMARQYLPTLRTEGGTDWAGHRPATADSLPVIGASPHHPHVFYAFGHGHLGLTQAATTGRLVSELVFGGPPSVDLTPYAIDRFN